MSEVIQAEIETEPVAAGNVVALHAQLARRRVPALSDSEILRLRAMLDEFDKIKSACPLAQRILRP